MGPPKGGSKSRFHAGFSHKSRQEIAWNSCSRQVYPITLNAMLIFHAITPIFTSNSRFHALKYVQSHHHAFPSGGPLEEWICSITPSRFPLGGPPYRSRSMKGVSNFTDTSIHLGLIILGSITKAWLTFRSQKSHTESAPAFVVLWIIAIVLNCYQQ